MKDDMMRRAIVGIDDKLIEDADKTQVKNRKKLSWIKWGSIAAMFVLVVAMGVMILPGMLKDDNQSVMTDWPTKHVPKASDASEIAGPITAETWSVTGNAGRYTDLQYSDIGYRTCAVAVNESYKGKSLGDGVVTGQDLFSLEMHEMNVEVYEITGVNPEIAVAIRFTEPDQSVNGLKHVYAYMNIDYVPETLGDFINDLDLNEKLEIGLTGMYQHGSDTVMFENLAKEKVLELLSACSNVENSPNAETGEKVLGISASWLGMNKSISLTKDGYLISNILETGKSFYIGTDKVNEFVEYVRNNCDGFIYVYDLTGGEVDEGVQE